MTIDTRWVDGNGYRPVRVRIRPIRGGKALADRRVTVSLTPTGRPNTKGRTTVTATVELSEGAFFGETVIPVPCSQIWNNLHVETREGGRQLSDLSARYLQLAPRSYYQWNEGAPTVLFVDSDVVIDPASNSRTTRDPTQKLLPDFRVFASLMPTAFWNGNSVDQLVRSQEAATDTQLLQTLGDLPRLNLLPPAALPTDWIALTSVDLIFVSLKDLETWQLESPAQWAAVRDWLATGTTLCVYGAGENFARLREIETRVGCPPLQDAADQDAKPHLGWGVPNPKRWGTTAMAHAAAYTYPSGVVPPTPLSPATGDDDPPVDPPFVVRRVELGHLVAIAAENPMPGSANDWNWMLTEVGGSHWMWYQRHGLSLEHENNDFWKHLIPGVGEAPVTSFLVLITLFMLAIGPVNYIWLRRRRRLYLLLLTVPLGALSITLGLLCYAFLTDGIGVRTRVRSITNLDQRSQRGVTWSWQTYYAGLSPSGGLTYPTDAAVFPVDFRPRELAATSRRRRLEYGAEQRFTAGYFPSRATAQFSVLESRAQTARIEVTREAAGGPPRVQNWLGVPIERLVLRTEDGQLWRGGELAREATAELATAEEGEEMADWNAILAQHRPSYPEGFDPYQIEDATRWFGMTSMGRNSVSTKASFATNLLQRKLRATITNNFSGLGPRTYLAIVEDGVQLSRGTDAREVAGFHAVLGNW